MVINFSSYVANIMTKRKKIMCVPMKNMSLFLPLKIKNLLPKYNPRRANKIISNEILDLYSKRSMMNKHNK